MEVRTGRSGWVAGLSLCAAVLSLAMAGCASVPVAATAPASTVVMPAEDDDFSHLVAQLRSDLSRYNKREVERQSATTARQSAIARDRDFAAKAKALFAPLTPLRMPVVGITRSRLDDSWGDPRDGGERRHKGIDIFAPRGTAVVAVADGIISYIGDQPKGGHCLWLTTESGTSFYYAHFDRWAPGIFEGMEVESGDLLGFVGNTGNAITTPPHLHFGISQNDEMVNPYPVLEKAVPVKNAHVRAPLGAGYGTH